MALEKDVDVGISKELGLQAHPHSYDCPTRCTRIKNSVISRPFGADLMLDLGEKRAEKF